MTGSTGRGALLRFRTWMHEQRCCSVGDSSAHRESGCSRCHRAGPSSLPLWKTFPSHSRNQSCDDILTLHFHVEHCVITNLFTGLVVNHIHSPWNQVPSHPSPQKCRPRAEIHPHGHSLGCSVAHYQRKNFHVLSNSRQLPKTKSLKR